MQHEGDQDGAERQQKDARQLPEKESEQHETESDEDLSDELRITHEAPQGAVTVNHHLLPRYFRSDNGNGEAWFPKSGSSVIIKKTWDGSTYLDRIW